MAGDTDSRSPYTTVSPFHRSLSAIGRPPSHIQYERDAVENRGGSDGDGDACDHLKVACTVLSWIFKKPSNQPDPKDRRPQSPDGSKLWPGSHTSTSRGEDDGTTSNPPPRSTTILAPTSQSWGPNPPSPSYSSRQSTALGTSPETSQSTASDTSAGASITSPTTSPGSNSSGASTSSTPASEDGPDPTSTIVLTSTIVSSVNSYSETLPPYIAHSSASQSPSPSSLANGPESQRLSNSPRLSPGTIAGIALGALALVLCASLALFLLLRRRRRQRGGKRRSIESARRRLEPYSYDDDSSRPVSSVWTWFGSVSASVDPDCEPHHRREPSPNSLDFKFAEKGAEAGHLGYGAYSPSPSPSPSPCPSPELAETHPLTRDAPSLSVRHSLGHDNGLPHLNVPPSNDLAPSSSSELLALARTDYAVAHRLDHQGDGGLERSRSGMSRTTATSGDVQSVEAL